jgi:hypothetical protein
MRMLIVIVLLLVAAPTAQTPNVSLSGVTYVLNSGRYVPVGDIKIVVTRRNSVIAEGSSQKPAGTFNLPVPAGEPFTVAFYGEKRVPEVQQLAGEAGTANRVNITMLTPAQYQQQRGALVSLVQKLECDLRQLPLEAKAARDEVQALIAAARANQ